MDKRQKFICKAQVLYKNKFDYSKINYVDSKTHIDIYCTIHDKLVSQVPAEHLRGKNGCVECQGRLVSKHPSTKQPKNKCKLLNNDKFIEKANRVHVSKYNYSLVDYLDSKTKVKISCPVHGEFEQFPYSHLRGKGCNLCAISKRTERLTSNSEEFTTKSNLAHDGKYDYSMVDYINSQTKVKIICPVHGMFEQLPYDHLSGHGCYKCTSSISKDEMEINRFLVDNGLKTITSSMSIIKPSQLDIYIPSHKIGIEYNGLYWHNEQHISNDYHLNKTLACEAKDIQLIQIFEDEWLNKKDIVKSRLKNILGLTKDKIYARKTDIKEAPPKDAKIFLDKNHMQGATNSSVKLGLYLNDDLVSLMTFNKPRLGIGASYDGYELSRFCNKLDTSVIGGADKLLKHFIKTYNPKEIISYADRRWSQGDLYEKLGFQETHRNKPNYWYIIGKNRKHRFNFRKELLKKDGFDTKNKTEHQIMLERGIYRIYDCGTITYSLKL